MNHKIDLIISSHGNKLLDADVHILYLTLTLDRTEKGRTEVAMESEIYPLIGLYYLLMKFPTYINSHFLMSE